MDQNYKNSQDETPAEEVPESGNIVVPDPEVASDPEPTPDVPVQDAPAEQAPETFPITVEDEVPTSPTSIGRAVQITDGIVENVLLVVVDEDLNVIGYEVPYGSQLVVVEDDSPITFGWTYVDEEFGEPVITDTTAE